MARNFRGGKRIINLSHGLVRTRKLVHRLVKTKKRWIHFAHNLTIHSPSSKSSKGEPLIFSRYNHYANMLLLFTRSCFHAITTNRAQTRVVAMNLALESQQTNWIDNIGLIFFGLIRLAETGPMWDKNIEWLILGLEWFYWSHFFIFWHWAIPVISR